AEGAAAADGGRLGYAVEGDRHVVAAGGHGAGRDVPARGHGRGAEVDRRRREAAEGRRRPGDHDRAGGVGAVVVHGAAIGQEEGGDGVGPREGGRRGGPVVGEGRRAGDRGDPVDAHDGGRRRLTVAVVGERSAGDSERRRGAGDAHLPPEEAVGVVRVG